MLASSAVISGLVICPGDIGEVKISSYDYIRGTSFDRTSRNRTTDPVYQYIR